MLLSIVYFPLIKIILIFAITTFNGIVVFNLLHNTKNKLINIGAGMIVGLLVLLLLLSVLSYLFKGTLSISIIFILYSIICFYLYKHKKRFSFTSLFKINPTKTNLTTITLILIYLVLIALYIPTSGLGPDTYMYQGIANSFVRGNYPTVLPWQPDFLTVYHHGAFIIFGAL